MRYQSAVSDEEKEQNLALLGLGLHRLSRCLGDTGFGMESYMRVDMESYMSDGGLADEYVSGEYTHTFEKPLHHGHECGTTACAIGHGPLFGITPDDGEDWGNFARRLFEARVYSWCFHGRWAHVEGMESRESAAKRIAWKLKMRGSCEPTCYKDWSGREDFEAWEPDWEEIEKMIPAEKLKGIEWIDTLHTGSKP